MMDENRQHAIEESLARARKTVAESRALMEQVNLRIQETDRLLAQQGLTREQLQNMRFTDEQRRIANEQLERMGLPTLEKVDEPDVPAPIDDKKVDLDERRDKFGSFMKDMRL